MSEDHPDLTGATVRNRRTGESGVVLAGEYEIEVACGGHTWYGTIEQFDNEWIVEAT